MLAPRTLLPLLLGGAVGLGGILQGLHWRSAAAPVSTDADEKLRAANEEISLLRRENESLRSLAQGGGETAVPRELIERVEREFALRFLSSPVVHRIASEELRDRIAAALESRHGPSGIDDRQRAYQLIGWLGDSDELLAQLTAVRAVGARGWFDEVTGEAWVTEKFDANSIPDQAALIRLIARILLHQHFPPPPSYPGDDAARAREALHHGAAAGSEARYYAANARAIGFIPMKPNAEAEQLFASLPPFIRGLTAFPVTEGKGLADTLHVRGGEILMAAFRNPPQTTQAILHPGKTGHPAEMNGFPVTPEEPYLTESAGELGLRLWLEAALDPMAASRLAAGWKNDRYVLVPDGDASSAVIWEIEMESKEAADDFQDAALKRAAAIAGIQSTPVPGQILSCGQQGCLRIVRPTPLRLRFIRAATPAFAEKLGG